MATLTVTKPLFGASTFEGKTNAQFVSVVVDFAQFTHTSTDVIEAITVPANTMVLTAGAECLTNDAGAGTVDIGMAALTFCDATNLQSGTIAEGAQLPGQNATAEFFNFTDAADSIDVTVATAVLTTGKIRVWAIMVSLDDPISAQRVTIA